MVSKYLLLIIIYCYSLSVFSQKNDGAKYEGLKPKDTLLFYAEEDEAELEELTDQGISELEELLKSLSGDGRGEVNLRLGQLYMEKSKLMELKAFREFDEKIKNNKNYKGRVNLANAHVFNYKAINVYKKFLKRNKKDDRSDQIYFLLGQNYFEVDKSKEGANYFYQLTKKFPQSPFIVDSNFALGEYYFEKEDWGNARKYYDNVAGKKNSRLYIFALYKSSWCYYRTGNPKKAFELMERVLSESRSAKEIYSSDGRKKIEKVRLSAEAINNLIPFYANSDKDYKSAFSYMERIGGSKLTNFLIDKLAFYYMDNGFRKEGRYLFKELIRAEPNSEKALAYKHQIVSSYTYSKDNKGFLTELKGWIKNYSKGSTWYIFNKDKKKLLADAKKVQEAGLRNYILQAHQAAKNSGKGESKRFASEGYALYMEYFPNSKNIDQMHYYYAELLFDMKQFKKSSKEYNWVLNNASKSPYAESALINATISLEKELPTDKEIKRKVGKSLKPIKLGVRSKRFEKTAKSYLKKYPNGERRVAINFKLGRLYYLHNQFRSAEKYFKTVVREEPKSQLGEFSANLILDIYNLKKDFSGMERAGKSLLKSGVAPNIVSDIKGVVEKSSFKKAQKFGSEGKFIASAKLYKKFIDKNPKSNLLETAYFNAGINFIKGGSKLDSTPFLLWITKNSKDKNLLRKSHESLRAMYLETGQYEKLVSEYKVLASIAKTRSERAQNLYNYALLKEGLGDRNVAVQNYLLYLKTYNSLKGNKKSEILFSLAGIYKKNKSWKKAIEYYKKFVNNFSKMKNERMVAHLNLSNIYEERIKDKAKSTYWLLKTIERQSGEIGKKEASIAKFKLSLSKYKKLLNLKWPLNVKAQRIVVNKKIKLIDQINNSMTEVIKYGVGETIVSSFTVLARSYLHMYNFFKKAPVPKGLKKSEVVEYKKQLLKQAQPFKKTAAENYLQALKSGRRLEALSSWFLIAKNELNILLNKKSRSYVPIKSQRIDWGAMN